MDLIQTQSGRGNTARSTGGAWLRLGAQTLLMVLGMVLVFSTQASAQHRVTGRVTSAGAGQGLAGVQVLVQGTTAGTRTDSDGRYTLTAPSSTGTLVFSLVGYGQQTAPIGGRDVINVALAAEAVQLEGIVAIGYGERRQVNLTESVGTVSTEQIEKVTVSTPEAAIQGRVTGVQLTQESGTPGAASAIRIRGVGTVGNTQPLFVIDGVPVGTGSENSSTSPLATINPSDIESISVLKDASAAAVYGVQAANGVVLIKTKRGRLGKPTIRYDGYTGVQNFEKMYQVNNSEQWFNLMKESLDNYNAYYGYTPSHRSYQWLHPDLRDGSAKRAEILGVNTDWAAVASNNNAPITNHNVSVSGASENVNYYVSAAVFGQEAIVSKYDMDRYSFRANSDFKINDRLRFGETFSLSNQELFYGESGRGNGLLLRNAVRMSPVLRFTDPNKVSPTNPMGYTGNSEIAGNTVFNMPVANQLVDVEDRNIRMLGSVYGEIDLLPGLTARTQGSVDYGTRREYYWNPGFTPAQTNLARPEQGTDERSENIGLTSTTTVTYDGAFGNHSFNVLGGFEAQRNTWSGIELDATGFVSQQEGIRRIVAGAQNQQQPGGWAGESGFLGYIGRVNYNYGDRYLLTLSMRRDAASTFAPGRQWGTFPAVSAGWRLSQESWFNVPFINEFKLRGSWGQLGNSNIEGGAYPHLVSVVTWANYALNGDRVYVAPTPRPRLSNPNLTWETNETRDFGFESTLFGNAVDFSLTYYQRNTRDFLLSIPLPAVSGLASAPINGGEMLNRGLEMELGYNTTVFNELDLSVSGNLTTVRNRLLSLAEGVNEYPSPNGNYRTAPGFPVGYFYGYQTCGVFRDAAAAAKALPDVTISNRKRQAGDMCFQDINGRDAQGKLTGQPDGRITVDDRTFLGKTIPDMFFGLNFNGNFRSLDFTAFFNGVQGVERFNTVRRDMEAMGGGWGNHLVTTQNRWTPQNPDATMPRAIQGDPADNARFSDRWVEDASYVRLKTLQLGYTLPDGTLGTNSARLYVTGTNLFTWTGYSGLDPEFVTTGNASGGNAVWNRDNVNQLAAGTDWGNIPQARMYQVGVSFSF